MNYFCENMMNYFCEKLTIASYCLQLVIFINKVAYIVGCCASGGFAEFNAGGITGVTDVFLFFGVH